MSKPNNHIQLTSLRHSIATTATALQNEDQLATATALQMTPQQTPDHNAVAQKPLQQQSLASSTPSIKFIGPASSQDHQILWNLGGNDALVMTFNTISTSF